MNLSASAKLQARSIVALLVSRMRARYIGSRAGYVWAIVEPLAWVFVLKMAIRHNGDQLPPVGDSYEVFFAVGVIPARMWRMIAQGVSSVMNSGRSARLPGLLRLDLCYANGVLEAITGFVVMIIALFILQVFGFHAVPGDILHFVIAFLAITAFGIAFGLTVGVVLILAPGLQHFIGMFYMVMFFTSGFAFVVDRMPLATKQIVLWNPLVHFIEWIRMGFYAGYECRSLDLSYAFVVTICCLLIGLTGERIFRRHAGRQEVYEDAQEV
ncbi:ABC transporter permease [Chenggangzhangella methanolivorans]|uniref:ABC transporter permease n=1 Tax=Chenggangzhangella methanolivorans TaxID=1437009 RepID=A0A9E6RBW8_9HYPH|nr:ABC transporter permease [Chenggangzhangella methanolivorans]QZO01407.1 ABC transporter permease [Chenggangzhangella methanolivorans]